MKISKEVIEGMKKLRESEEFFTNPDISSEDKLLISIALDYTINDYRNHKVEKEDQIRKISKENPIFCSKCKASLKKEDNLSRMWVQIKRGKNTILEIITRI